MSLWASFCITFTTYTTMNVIYAEKQDVNYYFTSEIETVASMGYRSPPTLFFQLDIGGVALIVKNEVPVKEKLKNGIAVKISGHYKKGMLSSIMIVDYTLY